MDMVSTRELVLLFTKTLRSLISSTLCGQAITGKILIRV